jgi:FlaA1/EpsC-like NDP-sugar epimerase
MEVTPELGMRAVCAIDDNPNKRGRSINGVPVVGNHKDIARAAEEYNIDLIVVAMPSATGAQRKRIVEACQATDLEVRVIPGVYQLVDGKVSVSRLREIKIEDLLGRDPVVVDGSGIHDLVAGRTVLVTGGGGSIGSEICRQVARENPRRLVIFDIYENNAYAIQQELWRSCPGLDLVVLIGSVRDVKRVRSVFATYRPDVVFHAAAHKHVPLMEDSPHEAIKNNVFGTLNVARAALEFEATRFVLISTDKAVNPTNVMGATKRLCEMIIQAEGRKAGQRGAKTTYSAVRFGNVLGSNGSVVPLFEKQIAEGGPVTVTHPDIIRYFMTIPEAVSLVLQSACYAQGGEIFVLDMGEPVKIADMARNLIQLAGYEPDVDIAIEYTGLRPGEKLYEERLMAEEGLRETANHMISVARPIKMDDAALTRDLRELAAALQDESTDIRPLLQRVVPTFHQHESNT